MIIYKSKAMKILCLMFVATISSHAIEKKKILEILNAAKQHKKVQVKNNPPVIYRKAKHKAKHTPKMEYGLLPSIPSSSYSLKERFSSNAKKVASRSKTIKTIKSTDETNPIAKQIKYY